MTIYHKLKYDTFMRALYITILILTARIATMAAADADSLFRIAKDLAYTGNYSASRQVCDTILMQAPDYADVLILKGRTYAWEQETDMARTELLKALATGKAGEDAYLALADNELWAGYYGRAEDYAHDGLAAFKGSPALLIKQAQVQYNMAKYHPALASVDSALVQEPQNETALKLREDILDMLIRDKIKIQHSIDWYSTPFTNVLQVTSIEYSKNFRKLTLIPRVSYGRQKLDSMKREDVQVEADAYYQLTPITSVYCNYGYGFNQIFPRHRHGLEIFQRLPQGFEASLGYRLLYYDNNGNGSLTDIYTGSVSKYWKSFWFSFRPYLVPTSGGVNTSYYLFGRYYYKTSDDYVELYAGSGFAADESIYAQMNLSGTNFLHTYRVGIYAQYRVKRICILSAGAAASTDEYLHKTWRPAYYATAGVSFFIK